MSSARHETTILSVCNLLSKGWEASILMLLAFMQRQYSLPLYVVGILSTVFIVSQIGISFFAGQIAHHFRGRSVVLLAISASGLSWLALFVTHHTPFLYLAFALGGMASGLFEPIGNSLVAKRSPAKNRGSAIGNFAAFGDIGRMAVVATTTSLAGWLGLNRACGLMFLTNVAAFAMAMAFIRNPEETSASQPREQPMNARRLLRNRRFRYATAAGMADSFSSSSLVIFLPFLLTTKGIALNNTGYFVIVLFAGYLAGRLVLGRLADRHGAPAVLIGAELSMALVIVVLTLSSQVPVLICLLFVLGIFTRGTSPIIRAMVADSQGDRTSFHDAFGAYSVASRGSTAVCRPVYGYLASLAGIAWVFYLAAAVSLLTLYPASKYAQSHEDPDPSP